MSAAHTSGRIDSMAFRRGVRAFKTGASNPYNGSELRDEWEAGVAFAAHKAARATATREQAIDIFHDMHDILSKAIGSAA